MSSCEPDNVAVGWVRSCQRTVCDEVTGLGGLGVTTRVASIGRAGVHTWKDGWEIADGCPSYYLRAREAKRGRQSAVVMKVGASLAAIGRGSQSKWRPLPGYFRPSRALAGLARVSPGRAVACRVHAALVTRVGVFAVCTRCAATGGS